MPAPKKVAKAAGKKPAMKKAGAAPQKKKAMKAEKPGDAVQKKKPAEAMQKKKHADGESLFWADQLAEQLVQRAKAAGKSEVIVKAGASPSGSKHIGNLFDVIKAYIVYKAVRDRLKFPARFILTHDDRDPLRSIPSTLVNRAGQRVPVTPEMKEKLSKYLGHPYSRIPDPFDCCRTWSEHFSRIWEDGILACGVGEKEIEFVSNETLYRQGKFEPYIEIIFKNIEKARKIIAQFQKTVKEGYVPFVAICRSCGKITAKVTGWDLKKKTVSYACDMKALAGKYVVQGCGDRGEVPWSEGKIVWRFEWPAQWGIFSVDFEAFGKEHAEGSWPSGHAIAKGFYGIEPPIPHIYEFLLVDGKKMAASKGNVFVAQEILEIIEPEVFMYLYTKRSKKERNLDLKNVHLLVNDFEKAERAYFGLEKIANEKELAQMKREYESSVPSVQKAPPLRIEYQFAGLVAQFAQGIDHAIAMLRQSGHIRHDKHLSPDEVSQVARRLSLAKNWVEKFAPENKVAINDTVPKEVKAELSEAQRKALHALGHMLEKKAGQQELYDSFYKIAQSHGLDARDFFEAAYMALIGRNSGPRLAPFILAIGQDRARKILEQA
jgi:lysyl-tRNA synthetase class 1